MATYYVTWNETGGGTGTAASPFQIDNTTNYKMDDVFDGTYGGGSTTAAQAGDTYIFKSGSYAASGGNFSINGSGNHVNNITLKSENPLGAIIYTNSTNKLPCGRLSGTATYTGCVIDGFKIMTNSGLTTVSGSTYGTAGFTFKNCFFDMPATNTSNKFNSNKLFFENCIFKVKMGGGKFMSGMNQSTFTNCSFIHDSTSVFTWFDWNTVNPSSGNGIDLKNCIFYKASGSQDRVGDGSRVLTGATVANNWQYNSGTNNHSSYAFLGSTDPLFVDASNGDYQLRPNSPLIGAGA